MGEKLSANKALAYFPNCSGCAFGSELRTVCDSTKKVRIQIGRAHV